MALKMVETGKAPNAEARKVPAWQSQIRCGLGDNMGMATSDFPTGITPREERLAVIPAANARLEERQREADAAKGRSEDGDRRPRVIHRIRIGSTLWQH